MKSAKQTVRDMLHHIPNKATLEDILYHIYVREKIERGLQEARQGKLISQEKLEKRLKRWL